MLKQVYKDVEKKAKGLVGFGKENIMEIVLVSGKARSGKDSFAKELKKKLEEKGKKVVITHYADSLKHICKYFFDWDGNKDERGRNLLQKVGTEGFRKKYPNFWINFIKNILEVFPDEWDFVIIPDCRFKNEIELWKQDGYCVHTVRMERMDYQTELTVEQQHHQSEIDLDDYEFDIKFCCPNNYKNIIIAAEDFVEDILNV